MKLKQIIILAILFISTLVRVNAQEPATNKGDNGIHFFEGSWDEALAQATKENKPIFLDIYASWCAPCKVLKSKTFPDKNVGSYFNSHFINVSLDGEKDEGIELVKSLQVQAYPSLFILKPNGELLAYYPGYLGPEEFIELGKAGIQQLDAN